LAALKLKSSWSGKKLESSGGGGGSGVFTSRSFRSSGNNDREEVMRRVREQQQVELAARAKIAAAERKQKQAEERERKNTGESTANKQSKKKSTTKSSGGSGEGYNPMQPWSSSSGGGGYKYVWPSVCACRSSALFLTLSILISCCFQTTATERKSRVTSIVPAHQDNHSNAWTNFQSLILETTTWRNDANETEGRAGRCNRARWREGPIFIADTATLQRLDSASF
jgi:hypothetical protein